LTFNFIDKLREPKLINDRSYEPILLSVQKRTLITYEMVKPWGKLCPDGSSFV